MNVKTLADGRVFVTLSRRNLNTLILMLDKKAGVPVISRNCDIGILVVKAEEDDDHYNSDERGSMKGIMGQGPEDVLNDYFSHRRD